MLGRECVQSDEELLSLGCVLAADDLVQTIDEDTGDIVVAGMQTANKAEQACDVANRIIRCVDQTRVMRDIESQLVAAGNANDTALFFFYCSVDLINKLLGLTGTGTANNKFYPSFYPPNL